MKVATARQMADLDRVSIEEYGIPSVALMENAGRACTATMSRIVTGGNVIDAADAKVRKDELGQVLTYFGAFPRQGVYESIDSGVDKDGAAFVEARGHELNEAKVFVKTRYTFHPNDRALLIEPMRETIHKVAPKARLVRLNVPPVIGAVILGMEAAGITATPSVRNVMANTISSIRNVSVRQA